ncbi:MAG: DnaJ domain-containing protein [Gammaproteobacteria bacterium]|nr:DnaJ domain-containing protein [Gammaproteobacteria bacterium]MCY4218795.1 DnaJ domain-containing protein [Gammaproteobacteria bacterium]MCY4274294.1 DnaJ domain-containing protein [Gammaproteobacteria bacterium]
MAPRVFLALVALIGIMWYLSWYKRATPKKRNQSLLSILLYGLGAALLLLVITGKIHFIFAILSALVPWINRALAARMIWRQFKGFHANAGTSSGSAHNQTGGNPGSMTEEEAFEILGLEPGANKEEIIEAHKKLMQKIHPDKGGSSFLASQINQAKDTLIKS